MIKVSWNRSMVTRAASKQLVNRILPQKCPYQPNMVTLMQISVTKIKEKQLSATSHPTEVSPKSILMPMKTAFTHITNAMTESMSNPNVSEFMPLMLSTRYCGMFSWAFLTLSKSCSLFSAVRNIDLRNSLCSKPCTPDFRVADVDLPITTSSSWAFVSGISASLGSSSPRLSSSIGMSTLVIASLADKGSAHNFSGTKNCVAPWLSPPSPSDMM
mmetsp:Transcript_122461/g.305789  ORF Transcript_122461/g.305789 Transcript_122461/m.305789 type:complete len:215 (-) Transcript_122461:473-1117(-)